MNMLFIYGPPAAGKLTVANEIANSLGYRVFLNHQLVGSVASVFSFDDDSLRSIRNRLARKFRLEIFEEAVKNNINLIATYGGSGADKFEFFKEVEDAVTGLGGNVLFVHLTPSKEVLMKRVESDSRKGCKIDNQEFLSKKLAEDNNYYESYGTKNNLVIDNSNLRVQEVAKKIIDFYRLNR